MVNEKEIEQEGKKNEIITTADALSSIEKLISYIQQNNLEINNLEMKNLIKLRKQVVYNNVNEKDKVIQMSFFILMYDFIIINIFLNFKNLKFDN